MGKKYDRLVNYANVKGLTLAKISRAVGISSGLLSKGAKEDTDISDSVCLKISEIFTDLNKRWLLTGVGEMLVSASSPPLMQGNDNTNIQGSKNTVNSAAALQSFTDEIKAQREHYDRLLQEKDAQINKLLEIIASK